MAENRVTLVDTSLRHITLDRDPPDKDTLKRLKDLRDLHFATRPKICVELPRLITEYMIEVDKKDGAPDVPELLAAKRLKYVLENKRAIIEDNNLLAGTTTQKPIGVLLRPHLAAVISIWPELNTVHLREKNPYDITQEEIEELNFKIFPYWMERTVFEKARSEYANPYSQELMERLVFFACYKGNGIGHTIPDYASVVNRGLKELKAEAEEKERALVNSEQDQNRAYYYQAVKLVIEGVLAYAENLSREAARLARTEQNTKRKQELEKMQQICARIPGEKPQTFQEAMNAIWICHIALHQENGNNALSLGRLDQILYDLYRQDIEKGMTPTEAVELVGCFWLKINDHVPVVPKVVERLVGGTSSNQAVTLGGVDEKGEDAVNDLTYVMLKATELLCLREPNVNCRYHPDNSPKSKTSEYLRRLCEVNINTGATPCFHNDASVIESLIEAFKEQGITLEHARDYAIVGCVEPVSSGRTFGHPGAIQLFLTSALELALFQGKHRLTEDKQIGPTTDAPETIDELDKKDRFPTFKKVFEEQLSWLIEQAVTLNNILGEVHQKHYPTPLLSTLTEGCMENGKDVIEGGALYNSSGVTIIGLAEVTDSLSAIQEFVCDKGEVTFAEMIEAIKQNWNDPYRKLHQKVRTSKEKFGTDSEMAKENADYIIDFLHKQFQSKENYRGGKYNVGYWTMTIHAGQGLLTGALPSGRVKGEPLPSGITPVSGSAPELTPCLNFVAHLDHSKIANGHALNLKYTPSRNRGKTITEFAQSIEGYMHTGGLQVQFNIIDRAKLEEAIKNPKKHKDLLVRVSGYTAYFIDLDPAMQGEIMTRPEYGEIMSPPRI
jgi:formate C-acetyltransferase